MPVRAPGASAVHPAPAVGDPRAGVPFPTVESGAEPAPEGPANFPTGWFASRDRAYQWLAS